MKSPRHFTIEEYNPEWKKRFENVADRLRQLLGDNLIEIEHIGSTSIEGMVAKPQIDVLAIVRDISKIKDIVGELEEVGFTYHGGGYIRHNKEDEYLSEDTKDGIRLTSVHILPKDNFEISEFKIFRDYLRNNIQDKELYINIKKELYALHDQNYPAYDAGKEGVVKAIIARAKVWSDNNNI
ncbi:GrpB family protein [Candidatus Wolfebacteria bacterium]|nr:GrpB family protein [Candidatus Wolfebacteria bacterium]